MALPPGTTFLLTPKDLELKRFMSELFLPSKYGKIIAAVDTYS